MINSTFNPESLSQFEKSKLNFNGQKVSGICPAGQSINLDLALEDDHLITGAALNLANHTNGDELKFQVVHPTLGVLNTFIDWFAVDFDKDFPYPAKIAAGLILRLTYTSKGTSDVGIFLNYNLHKVLV